MLFSDFLNARFTVAAERIALRQLVTRALGRMACWRRGLHHAGGYGKTASGCRMGEPIL